MKVARGVLIKKFWAIGLLGLISASIILFFPPDNLPIIVVFNMCVSLIVGLIVRLFSSRKHALLLMLLIFIILTLKAFDLFDALNIVLAISLLAGVSILIK
jgi:hypothetical protein